MGKPSISKELTVRYLITQGCSDFYKSEKTGRIYARKAALDKRHVQWCTASRSCGGYEESSPLKEGSVIRVIDDRGNLLFEELMEKRENCVSCMAEAKGYFASDRVKEIAIRYAELFHLISHDEWRKRLACEKKKYDYDGDMDNWLYYEVKSNYTSIIDSVKVLGEDTKIKISKYKYRLCNLEWLRFSVMNSSVSMREEMCGYLLCE